MGEGRAWNAGTCCRHDSANDVGYLVDLVHYVSTLTPVDLHRVYIWGFSNGGMMAWRAVCQTRNVFAGAGVMAGALLVKCPVAGARRGPARHRATATVPLIGGYSRYTHTDFPDSAERAQQARAGSTLHACCSKISGTGGRHRGRSGRLADVLWNGLSHSDVGASGGISAPV